MEDCIITWSVDISSAIPNWPVRDPQLDAGIVLADRLRPQTERRGGAASVAPYKRDSSLACNARQPGAQTERRGDAGPVRDLLGNETSLAAFFALSDYSSRSTVG